MSNLNIRLNMASLKHTVQKMKGKNGEVEVLVIPIDANSLYRSDKGGLYLDATAFELKEPKTFDKTTNTHLIKQSLPKDVYSKMSDEEKREQPILGNVSVWTSQLSEPEVQTSEAGDELPW